MTTVLKMSPIPIKSGIILVNLNVGMMFIPIKFNKDSNLYLALIPVGLGFYSSQEHSLFREEMTLVDLYGVYIYIYNVLSCIGSSSFHRLLTCGCGVTWILETLERSCFLFIL